MPGGLHVGMGLSHRRDGAGRTPTGQLAKEGVGQSKRDAEQKENLWSEDAQR